jgi:hypothetical protein
MKTIRRIKTFLEFVWRPITTDENGKPFRVGILTAWRLAKIFDP